MKTRWTPEMLTELRQKRNQGASFPELATYFHRSPTAVSRVCERNGIRVAEEKVAPATTLEEDKSRVSDATWQTRHDELNKKYQKLLKEQTVIDQLVEEISVIAPKSYDPAPPVRRPGGSTTSEPQEAVLHISDSHIGQVVSADQTLLYGSYNMGIFLDRLAYLEDAVTSICTEHVNTRLPALHIAWGGDLLHGDLGHGNEAAHLVTLFEQFYAGSHAFAQFVRNVAANFEHVHCWGVVGNHCVDEATEILTQRGWKTVDEVKPSDLCLGLEKDGRTASWQPIDSIVRETQVDRMVSISNSFFNFRGTEHHRFYYWIPGHPMLNEARWSEIKAGHRGILIPAAGLSPGTGEGVPDECIELAAAVLTDGCLSEGVCSVYQRPEKEAWVKEAFDKTGLEYYVYRRSRQRPAEICGVPLKNQEVPSVEVSYRLSAESFRKFQERTGISQKGSLPPWVFKMTKEQFDRFLFALIDGDGTFKGDGSAVLYGKNCSSWLDEVQALCVCFGVRASLANYGEGGKFQRLNLQLYGDPIPLGERATVEYTAPAGERVWCVRTRTENFMCRRGGKSYFTGNTRWANQKRMPTVNRFSNLDMFAMAIIEALTASVDNVHWHLTKQPFVEFDVLGYAHHLSHGDHLRGGDKSLGVPAHAFGRELSVTSQLAAKHGKPPVNYYLHGHFHRPMELPHAGGEILVNGGWPGIDEYALTSHFNPADPQQRLYFVHPTYGRTANYYLSLKHAARGDGDARYTLPTL